MSGATDGLEFSNQSELTTMLMSKRSAANVGIVQWQAGTAAMARECEVM